MSDLRLRRKFALDELTKLADRLETAVQTGADKAREQADLANLPPGLTREMFIREYARCHVEAETKHAAAMIRFAVERMKPGRR